jgi:hypothetical protein
MTTDTEIFIVPIHTSPTNAVSEIDALADVFDDAVTRFGVSNGIVMGVSFQIEFFFDMILIVSFVERIVANVTYKKDFNAGCSYVTSSDWPYIRLRNESR